MNPNRRQFVTGGVGLVAGFAGLRRLLQVSVPNPGPAMYGELVVDPDGILDLPLGFGYSIFSRAGEEMDDGFLVPGLHDGMAAFPGSDGRTILVRNHELAPGNDTIGPFGEDSSLMDRLDPSLVYDRACPGGTTTLVYDTREQKLDRHFLSLTGTSRNCAGGPTPWNSWVSCEEPPLGLDDEIPDGHGYNFEVPAAFEGLVLPVPLREMGRFRHEAIAVDSASGVVYQTEDRRDSLFYRFIPDQRGELARGGRLQALRIRDMDTADTSNQQAPFIEVGQQLGVDWVDLEDPEAPQDDLRTRGAAAGAAVFVRGEGAWSTPGLVYFATTSGGANRSGQIWRYRPSPAEGTSGEDANPGTIELFLESGARDALRLPDNVTVSPWGDLIVCEDARDSNYLRGVTPRGEVYPLAYNRLNGSELAGATFSPDGATLFVNIWRPGLTLAITGPWQR